MTKNWEYGKRWDQTYRLTFINSPRLKTSRDLLLSFVNPSLWNASRITFCTGKCQNALADGRILLYSYRMDPSLAKSITYVQMKLSFRGAKKSKVAFLLDRVDPVVVSPWRRKKMSWETRRDGSIERSEKLGGSSGWVRGRWPWTRGGGSKVSMEGRPRERVHSRMFLFPWFRIPPKVKQEVAAFPPFPSIFPDGLRAAGLIDTFNDSGKNGE